MSVSVSVREGVSVSVSVSVRVRVHLLDKGFHRCELLRRHKSTHDKVAAVLQQVLVLEVLTTVLPLHHARNWRTCMLACLARARAKHANMHVRQLRA